jgi:hypothetical protein
VCGTATDLARGGEKLREARRAYPEHVVVPDGAAGEPRVVADELGRQLVGAGLRRRHRHEEDRRDGEQRDGVRARHFFPGGRAGRRRGESAQPVALPVSTATC